MKMPNSSAPRLARWLFLLWFVGGPVITWYCYTIGYEAIGIVVITNWLTFFIVSSLAYAQGYDKGRMDQKYGIDD